VVVRTRLAGDARANFFGIAAVPEPARQIVFGEAITSAGHAHRPRRDTGHGKIVTTYLWGWVNTLVGPDSDFIYKYRGRYFVVTFDREVLGPHRTLQDLLQQEELLRITPDTLAITCTELTADQLLPYFTSIVTTRSSLPSTVNAGL